MVNYNTLADAIDAEGLGSPEIIHDSEIHRFTGDDDKPDSNNCWYISYGNAGAFGSWKLGMKKKWSNGKISSSKAAATKKQNEVSKQKKVAEIESRQRHAMGVAYSLYGFASDNISHLYPQNKKIIPYGAKQLAALLLVPIYFNGDLVNVQRIYEDGSKRFLKGGKIKGCYYIIGTLIDRAIICEGYATGCSLHEYTGDPVVIAFNAGNLKPVALSIREQYPDLKIIIAADNDIETEGNPGRTKGKEAAAAVAGNCLYPDFSDESFDSKGLTDFNDYLVHGGKL